MRSLPPPIPSIPEVRASKQTNPVSSQLCNSHQGLALQTYQRDYYSSATGGTGHTSRNFNEPHSTISNTLRLGILPADSGIHVEVKQGWALDWAPGWVLDWAPGWVLDWAPGWAQDWAPGWVLDWAPGWVLDWAAGWVLDWATGWADGFETREGAAGKGSPLSRRAQAADSQLPP
ncbi:UNVERIFIED_CONTAM: hypothetical protein FKN15_072552 [Acipenser sinensis]